MDALIAANRDRILALAAEHGGYNVRLFGSRARGEARPDSDVDLLVEFERGRNAFDLVHLIEDLKALLGTDVDTADPESIHWTFRERVLREAVEL